MRRPGEARAVEDIDKVRVLRTDKVAEERDLVGVYLHEISRTPLLDAAQEVVLAKSVEAGLFAEHLLDTDDLPEGISREELERLVVEGARAKDQFIRATLRLAAALGVPVERVLELMRWSQDTVSLDTPVGDDGDTNLGDLVADSDAPSPEDVVLAALERQRIESLLNLLDDRSAGIMRARYGLEDGREHSLTEVATRFSLSRERIRQLEIQALGRLRELARAEGLQAA